MTEAIGIEHNADGSLVIRLAGDWSLQDGLPSAEPLRAGIESGSAREVTFDAASLGRWDSGLLTFLLDIRSLCADRDIAFRTHSLPEGVRRLLALSAAVPARADARRTADREGLLARVGKKWIGYSRVAGDALGFLGEAMQSLGRALVGRANFRRSDFILFLQHCGADALPIVSLISILIGLILAFVGSLQLKMFGAQIFVANLVGIAMVREMGAMMTAIIMAGRTGAAYAAQLGTMQVNEEIDALQTFGVSPSDFLVLPRMLALIIMMPLLCIYANMLGIFGGYVVGVHMLDLSATQYLEQTVRWIKLKDISLGIGKSVVFGIIIAICGCLAGLQSGRNAAAVGAAATTAVVTAIVWIIVADGLFAVLTSVLGI
jgi:phospholipid/cholesterol/gamma-HCH transport system permease protein